MLIHRSLNFFRFSGACLFVFVASFAQAELAMIEESELADVTGQAGINVVWEGLEFKPNGLHPVEDPDNPPFPKFVDTSNKMAMYGDSTADGVTELDFWVYIDRVTTNPRTADGVWGIDMDIDITARQVERWRIEQLGASFANKSTGISNDTKQVYFVLSIDDYTLDMGPGSQSDERYGTTRYTDLNGNVMGGGSACAGGTQAGTPDCYFRGLSYHNIAADSFAACAAGYGQCDGLFFKEVNMWGSPIISGQMLVYGRDGSRTQ